MFDCALVVSGQARGAWGTEWPDANMLAQAGAAEDRYVRWSGKRLAQHRLPNHCQ